MPCGKKSNRGRQILYDPMCVKNLNEIQIHRKRNETSRFHNWGAEGGLIIKEGGPKAQISN